MTRRLAGIVHSALLLSVLLIAAMFSFARTFAQPDIDAQAANLIRYVGLILLLVSGIVISKMRTRVPPYRSGDDPDAWWAANTGHVATLWAVAEGTATTGGIFWFLTGDQVMLIVLAAAGVLLFRLRPANWTGGAR